MNIQNVSLMSFNGRNKKVVGKAVDIFSHEFTKAANDAPIGSIEGKIASTVNSAEKEAVKAKYFPFGHSTGDNVETAAAKKIMVAKEAPNAYKYISEATIV